MEKNGPGHRAKQHVQLWGSSLARSGWLQPFSPPASGPCQPQEKPDSKNHCKKQAGEGEKENNTEGHSKLSNQPQVPMEE